MCWVQYGDYSSGNYFWPQDHNKVEFCFAHHTDKDLCTERDRMDLLNSNQYFFVVESFKPLTCIPLQLQLISKESQFN